MKNHDGTGPAIVLVPGLGARYEVFDLLSDELRSMGLAHSLVDPPGFGHRDPQEEGVLLEQAADYVVNSGSLPEGPKVYVGWSAGGMAAIEMVKRDPDAAGLVIMAGVFDDFAKLFRRPLRYLWRYPLKAATLTALLYYLCGWLPRFILQSIEKPKGIFRFQFWPMVKRPGKLDAKARKLLVRYNRERAAWRQLKVNRHYAFTAELAATLKVPLLVIVGKRDPLDTRPEKSEFLRAYGGPVTVKTVDTGHCVPLEAPAQAAWLLTEFIHAPS